VPHWPLYRPITFLTLKVQAYGRENAEIMVWHDRVTNEELMKRAGMQDLSEVVRTRMQTEASEPALWLPEDRTASVALNWVSETGRRTVGRQQKTWRVTFWKICKECQWRWGEHEKSTTTANDGGNGGTSSPSVHQTFPREIYSGFSNLKKKCSGVNTASCLTWRQTTAVVNVNRTRPSSHCRCYQLCCKQGATLATCCSQSSSVVLTVDYAKVES